MPSARRRPVTAAYRIIPVPGPDERGAVRSRASTFPFGGSGILSRGEVSEWLKVPLSKSGVREHRGFESHPLRHSSLKSRRCGEIAAERSPSGLGRRTGNAVWRKSSRVQIPPSPPSSLLPPNRAHRFLPPVSADWVAGAQGWVRQGCYDSGAVLGGELAVPCNLQSAPAGLNSLPRFPFSKAATTGDVEGRVPRSGGS